MSTYAVIYNGPPGSGKDESCIQSKLCFPFTNHLMFKEKLFELVLCIYDIPKEVFFTLYNNRETKDEPSELLRGLSPREAMIYVSEEVIKPKFGKDYFGQIAAGRIKKQRLNVFSDGGFIEELAPVYDVTEGNVIIVRLFKQGCNFAKDSRSYIESYKDCKIFDLHNNGTILDLRENINHIIETYTPYKGALNL